EQHRRGGVRHAAGADDDGGHGVRRAQLARRQSRARAPGQLVPTRLHQGPLGAVPGLRAATTVGPAVRARRRRLARRARSRGPLRGSGRGLGGAARADPPAGDGGTTRSGGGWLMAELRSFIFIDQLQPQTMSTLGTWIRGSLPRSHMAAQIIEVAPGLDIEPLTDVALKHADVQAGVLVVERQYGYLELHSRSTAAVTAAASAVLDQLEASAGDAMAPKVLASKIVAGIDHLHAFLINRS